MSPTEKGDAARYRSGARSRELRRKGVTLTLLWHEYKAVHPEGLQFSQFCERYRAFAVDARRCPRS